jgi:hypothetical protein
MDIDGPLNGHVSTASGYCGICPVRAARLNRILEATDAQLVISSAWRYLVHKGAMTLDGFEHLLCTHGVKAHGRIFSLTCTDESVPERGDQIAKFIGEYDTGCFRAYLVIDDLDLGISRCGHPFIQVDGTIGLTDEHVETAIRMLNGV